MTDLAELVAGWIYSLRITCWQQWVLRMVVLASGLGAAALCSAWFPVMIASGLLVPAVLLALAAMVRPDSAAGLLYVAVVALWWMAGGAEAVWWQWLAVAALVAVFHLTTAFAGAAPSYARITGRAGARMSRGLGAFVALSVAVGGVALAVMALPAAVLGFWWVAAGTLSVVAVTVAVVAALRPSEG